jgi:hypothetical protein
MHQMGHTDPKLALRIYTKVMGEQRRRGPGARLVGVLDGATWTEAYSAHAGPVRTAASDGRRLRVHKPVETDPQKRAEAVREAGSMIETTARIDTITLGRD